MRPDRRIAIAKGASIVGAALLLVWILLTTVYFLRSNTGLLPSAGRPFGLFGGLFGSWSFSLRNSPPLGVLQALFGIGLTHAAGLLYFALFHGRDHAEPPNLATHALAFTLGFGITGIAFELLTMAHGLRVLPVWILWIVLLMVPGAVLYRQRGWPAVFDAFRLRLALPSLSKSESVLWWGMITMAVTITLLTFWHAVFYPETNWDSLILYLGYARMTFLQHAFPFKAEVQVGIGLGANYPHIYSTFGAMTSTLFAHWSDMPQRLISPIAGIASCLLVYASVRELWRDSLISAICLLIFRSIPHCNVYTTFASDYAFAILFTAAFVYTAIRYTQKGTTAWLMAFTAIPAFSMHLNFLMGILWVPWSLTIFLTHWRIGGSFASPFKLLKQTTFWAVFAVWIVLGSTWYIRNYVLTGNPVYAFFPEIFTSSVRINPEVLRSAELEWFRVGDGIGVLSENLRGLESGEDTDVSRDDFQRTTGLSDRLRWSFLYWEGFETAYFSEDGELVVGSWFQRIHHLSKLFVADPPTTEATENYSVLRWRHAYKYAPLMPVYMLPAMLIGLVLTICQLWRKRLLEPVAIGLLGCWSVTVLLLAFNYLLADFYSYQIIGIVASGAVGVSLIPRALSFRGRFGRIPLYLLSVLVFVQSVCPGLAFALMNFKFSGARSVDGQFFSQTELDVFRNPGLPEEIFYRLQYGDDPDMWDYVNENLKGERLLTHENRHYVYDPSITLVHLDDWEIQKGYDPESPETLLEFLESQGIRYYLRIPNEANHRINRRLGMDMLEQAGLMKIVHRAGDNVLYKLSER